MLRCAGRWQVGGSEGAIAYPAGDARVHPCPGAALGPQRRSRHGMNETGRWHIGRISAAVTSGADRADPYNVYMVIYIYI